MSASHPSAGSETKAEIAVVIPCYRVGERVLEVLDRIGPEVGWIFLVDDACPLGTAERVAAVCTDPRLRILRHERNLGVGGAVCTGFRAALESPARVVVKLDGDGQMDPALIPRLTRPLREGWADYAKGNRFHRLGSTAGMPSIRLLGNAALSFLSKLSTGYWQIFDPTNGFLAIRREVLALLPLDRIARRYFFESDLLYHLGQLRAVVIDVPMKAVYGDEPSSLSPLRMILPFAFGHARNFLRRVVASYFVRGFSLASVELLLGLFLLAFGAVYGGYHWAHSLSSGQPASAGTVMLAGLPVIIGVQLLLSWLSYDIHAEPRTPITPLLREHDH